MTAFGALLLLAAAGPPLSCGGVAAPGIAERGVDGVWRGLAVDLCRRIAAHINVPAPPAFHPYDSLAALRAAAGDRVAFLSEADLAMPPLDKTMRAGPVFAVERQILLTTVGLGARAPKDLADQTICFIIGTRAEAGLDAWAARDNVPIRRLAFQEPTEMWDAYAIGKCAALALDAAEVSASGHDIVLTPDLAATPVRVATPRAAGADWARIVAQIVTLDPLPQ